MPGLDFVVTGGTADATLPVAAAKDRLLTAGSLVLFDPVHSADAMATGLVSLQEVPNIAWAEAAAVLGAGSAATLAGQFKLGSGNTGGTVLTERSAKGGIHVVMAQTGQAVNTQGAFIDLPAALKAYLVANPNNAYYISRWIKKTRVALSGGPSEGALYGSGISAVGNSLFNITPAGLSGNFSASEVAPGINQTGDIFLAAATSSWAGTDPASMNADARLVAWGQTIGSYMTGIYNNKSASYVLYRVYMEDLTVSGRSYAEVHAIDKAFWEADMAAGGRYYGDTYTDPATLP